MLGLPLVACAAPPPVAARAAPSFGLPRAAKGGLLLLCLPGLNASDLLVGAAEGALPYVAAMVERGLLVEGIAAPPGVIYTPEEVWQECLSARPRPPGRASAAGLARLEGDATLTPRHVARRLRSLAALGAGEARTASGIVVLADDGLLALQLADLLADERQPGYDADAALKGAREWRQALLAVDACLGQLLRAVDLSAWAVALVSTCEAAPVYQGLDVAALQASWRDILSGGAILEAGDDVVFPADGGWQEAERGRSPNDEALRLLAPPGRAFVLTGEALPLATPRPGGLLLAAGRGAEPGKRLPPLSPPAIGLVLSRMGE